MAAVSRFDAAVIAVKILGLYLIANAVIGLLNILTNAAVLSFLEVPYPSIKQASLSLLFSQIIELIIGLAIWLMATWIARRILSESEIEIKNP